MILNDGHFEALRELCLGHSYLQVLMDKIVNKFYCLQRIESRSKVAIFQCREMEIATASFASPAPVWTRSFYMLRVVNKFKRAIRVLTGLVALCLSSLGLAASPVLDRVVENGVLKVAMSVDQPPFNMRSRDKSVIGFDVDLAQALADAMQVKLEIVETPFGELLAALADSKADMVISGMTITPERTRKVSFVGPYTLSGKSILTTARIKGVAEDSAVFNDAEIRVVALKNSTSESFVQRNLPKASLHTIGNYDEGIQMLLTGRIDAMVADIPILKLSMLRYPGAGLSMIEPALSIEPLGIALPNNDKQFENLVRNYMSSLDRSGLTTRLREKWFEDNSWITQLP
jgi:polar amino acid transport system substrate-binding protein